MLSNAVLSRMGATMPGEEIAAPAKSVPAALPEDLLALAAYEYQTALTTCGDCQDYHATFGYARLADTKTGMKTDATALASLLAGCAGPGVRVLIAASADAGLCALVAGVLAASKPAITVADLCATPLAVCRFFAGMHGFAVDTLQLDVARMPIPARSGVVLAHNVLSFVPPSLHTAFLTNLRNALVPGGTLVIGNRVRPRLQNRADPLAHGQHGRMVDALQSKGIPLPEDEAIFRHRLDRLDEERYSRPEGALDLPRIEAYFAATGFAVRERIDGYAHSKGSKPTDSGDRATSHFFAAQRID